MRELIWEFQTNRFTVRMVALEEYDLDLSWDDTGEVREKIEDGTYEVFCAKCEVLLDGDEIASDYLGQCIYESFEAFRDHIGIKKQGENVGSYFSDMVRQAVKEARRHVLSMEPVPYIREIAD